MNGLLLLVLLSLLSKKDGGSVVAPGAAGPFNFPPPEPKPQVPPQVPTSNTPSPSFDDNRAPQSIPQGSPQVIPPARGEFTVYKPLNQPVIDRAVALLKDGTFLVGTSRIEKDPSGRFTRVRFSKVTGPPGKISVVAFMPTSEASSSANAVV